MTAETKIKGLVAIISLAAFFFSIFQFLQAQAISAKTPYLERKLAWCEEAVEISARIATAESLPQEDIARFWELYWGVMNMIERKPVSDAMISFGDELRTREAEASVSKDGDDLTGLTGFSRKIARACRDELAIEWSSSWAR